MKNKEQKKISVYCGRCGGFICNVCGIDAIDESKAKLRERILELEKQNKELQDKYAHLQGSMELLGKINQSNNG